MASFVKFVEAGTTESGLTRIWLVKNSRSDFEIGRIRWFSNWRKYIFEPATNCIFDSGCLQEITEFIIEAMNQHVLDARARRASLPMQK